MKLILETASRLDAYFGPVDVFNQEVFDQTRSYWGEIIDLESAVDAVVGRVQTSNQTNPTFSLSFIGQSFLMGETAAYTMAFGDAESFTVNRTLVEYLFRTILTQPPPVPCFEHLA